MNSYLYLAFVPFLASFGCFIAFDYFATPSLHGVISGDILLFILILILPRKSIFKIFIALAGIAAIFAFNPIMGACILFAVGTSFIKRDFKWPSIVPITLFFLFSLVADCITFFKETFMMNLSQLWEVSSFFWWGAILFFLIPLGYVAAITWFSRKIFWEKDYIVLKPLSVALLMLLTLVANVGFTYFQGRMLLVDFPIYRCFQDYNVHKPFDDIEFGGSVIKNENLSEDTKKVFEIWPHQNDSMIKKKAVFVLVESYGVHKDTTIAKQMIFPPFKGANVSFAGILPRKSAHTQGAELEDLGNVSYHDSSEIPFLSSMKKENIESWFLHGYVGSFYSRNTKYKQFGFDSLLFIDDLKKRNLKTCRYGFEGICDSTMINLIDSILSRPGDKYVFWTTLDSHPPYQGDLDLPAYSIFCKNLSISDKECMYLSLIENTLKNVARLAQKHPEYQFVIRGDHRPMATIDPNDYYYAWVPMIILN